MSTIHTHPSRLALMASAITVLATQAPAQQISSAPQRIPARATSDSLLIVLHPHVPGAGVAVTRTASSPHVYVLLSESSDPRQVAAGVRLARRYARGVEIGRNVAFRVDVQIRPGGANDAALAQAAGALIAEVRRAEPRDVAPFGRLPALAVAAKEPVGGAL